MLKKDEVYNPEKHKGLQARQDAEIEAVWDKEPKTKPYETERQNLRAKIFELEKQRPINQQLDASQQAHPNLPMMNARVQPSPALNARAAISASLAFQRDAVLDTIASVTNLDTAKNALRSYNDFLANPKGAGSSPNNRLDISNQVSDRDMSVLRGAANSDVVRLSIDFAKQKNTSLAWNTAADTLETSLNSATEETPGLESTIKASGTLDRERFIQSKGEDIRLNKTYVFRPGGSVANLEKTIHGKIASAMGLKLDTLGAGSPQAIIGAPIAAALMLTNLKGDIYDAPVAYMQIKVDTSRPGNDRGSQASSLASQASSAVGLRRNRRGRVVNPLGVD